MNWGTQQGGFPKHQKTCGDWRGYVRLFRAPATLTVCSAFFPTASLVVMGKTAALREPAPEEAAGSTGWPVLVFGFTQLTSVPAYKVQGKGTLGPLAVAA